MNRYAIKVERDDIWSLAVIEPEHVVHRYRVGNSVIMITDELRIHNMWKRTLLSAGCKFEILRQASQYVSTWDSCPA